MVGRSDSGEAQLDAPFGGLGAHAHVAEETQVPQGAGVAGGPAAVEALALAGAHGLADVLGVDPGEAREAHADHPSAGLLGGDVGAHRGGSGRRGDLGGGRRVGGGGHGRGGRGGGGRAARSRGGATYRGGGRRSGRRRGRGQALGGLQGRRERLERQRRALEGATKARAGPEAGQRRRRARAPRAGREARGRRRGRSAGGRNVSCAAGRYTL
jgi:hypothetical protein